MFKTYTAKQRETINIFINSQKVQIPSGITVAAALLSNGYAATRSTALSGAKRGPFCMMGVCYECLLNIDGKANQRACSTQVRAGMNINFQQGATVINKTSA